MVISMQMMRNKKIILQKRTSGLGAAGQSVQASKTVWARVEDISLSYKARMEQAGLAPEFAVHVNRFEFEKDSFNYCVVSGKAFRVSRTGTSNDPLDIKLLLERG